MFQKLVDFRIVAFVSLQLTKTVSETLIVHSTNREKLVVSCILHGKIMFFGRGVPVSGHTEQFPMMPANIEAKGSTM